jgi:hypothetical protein
MRSFPSSWPSISVKLQRNARTRLSAASGGIGHSPGIRLREAVAPPWPNRSVTSTYMPNSEKRSAWRPTNTTVCFIPTPWIHLSVNDHDGRLDRKVHQRALVPGSRDPSRRAAPACTRYALPYGPAGKRRRPRHRRSGAPTDRASAIAYILPSIWPSAWRSPQATDWRVRAQQY